MKYCEKFIEKEFQQLDNAIIEASICLHQKEISKAEDIIKTSKAIVENLLNRFQAQEAQDETGLVK